MVGAPCVHGGTTKVKHPKMLVQKQSLQPWAEAI